MTQIADPYPTDLAELDAEDYAAYAQATTPEAPQQHDPIVVALNRIAVAIERNTAALLGRPQTAPNAPQVLAALPPVQTVAARPSCPLHGIEKVAPSTNGRGGFYCQAKAGPGQPSNPKGYCTWHT